jgi:hypothetical protein
MNYEDSRESSVKQKMKHKSDDRERSYDFTNTRVKGRDCVNRLKLMENI